MTRDEQFLARILFIVRLLKANADEFQQLFWAVLTAQHGQDFVPVRPQGTLGDGGSDGYLPAEGHYFQVYGPVDPTSKVTTACSKLSADLRKILKSWNSTVPVKSYSFVFNDKYEGPFHEIVHALAALEQANPTIRCRPFNANHLEAAFLALPDGEILGILGGMLPDPARIGSIDYGVLREVMDHIMTAPATAAPTRFGELPALDEKIKLNHLSNVWGDLIRHGARKSGHIDRYFAKNSTFAKQALRDHLVGLYNSARSSIHAATLPKDVQPEDLTFAAFRQSLLPTDANVAAEAAADILIGYYFEACDIFDPFAKAEGSDAPA